MLLMLYITGTISPLIFTWNIRHLMEIFQELAQRTIINFKLWAKIIIINRIMFIMKKPILLVFKALVINIIKMAVAAYVCNLSICVSAFMYLCAYWEKATSHLREM